MKGALQEEVEEAMEAATLMAEEAEITIVQVTRIVVKFLK